MAGWRLLGSGWRLRCKTASLGSVSSGFWVLHISGKGSRAIESDAIIF